MISRKLRALLIVTGCIAVSVLLVPSMHAQISTGGLVGTVSDTNGARIAGATVSAEEVGSALKRVAVTNSAGEYRIDGLPPDDYRVTVTTTNFSPTTYAVKVTVNSSPTIP